MGWLVARLWRTPVIAPCGHGGSDNNDHGGSPSCVEHASSYLTRCVASFIFVTSVPSALSMRCGE